MKQIKHKANPAGKAHSKSNRSMAQRDQGTANERDQGHSALQRSSAQQMEEVKRTASQRGQASSKSMITSAQQIKQNLAWPRETYHVAKTKTTSVGRTNNAPQSKTFTAPRSAQNSKNQNYIFRTNEQCPAKQNIYGPAKRTK